MSCWVALSGCGYLRFQLGIVIFIYPSLNNLTLNARSCEQAHGGFFSAHKMAAHKMAVGPTSEPLSSQLFLIKSGRLLFAL